MMLFSSIVKLVKSSDWKILSQSLAPEVCELIDDWQILSEKEKGEKSGYIVGKYGTDILLPGAGIKAISKGVKGAKELASIAKNLQKVENMIVLEALTETGGNAGTFAEIIYTSNFTKNSLKEFSNNVMSRNINNIEFIKHALKRAIERNVFKESIFETLNTPLKIEKIKIDNFGRPSQCFIGKKAEVVINPEINQIVSVKPTSSNKADKLIKGLNND
jgi:hypothetical protein